MKRFLYTCLAITLLLTASRPAHAGLSVLGGLGVPLVDFPVGNFIDVNKFGYGFQAKYLKGGLPFVSFGTSIGYYRYNGKRLSAGTASLNDFGFTTIPLMLTVQANPPIPGFKPYANLSAGIYYLTAKAGVLTVPVLGTIPLPKISTTKFGVAPSGGILLGLVPGIVSLEVNASYHIIFTPLKKTTFFTLLAGVNIGIL